MPNKTKLKPMLNKTTAISLIFFATLLLLVIAVNPFNLFQNPIRVGILHSLTGSMAISEIPVVNASLLAIEEINNNGGLLGRKIEAIVVDGQSDNTIFARKLEHLIVHKKVDAIFGCWTSACRRTIKPLIEKYQHIFFYPIQYEGLEQSSNIIYTGATPNQQIIPALHWAIEHLGKRFFLIGSDYIFPHAANQIIHDVIYQSNASIIAERYIPLASKKMNKELRPIIDEIIETKPDVIINTINGDANLEFFKQLQTARISAKQIPVISFSIGESELQQLDNKAMQGHYSVWNYFQSINNPINKKFIKNYKQRYGQDSVTSDPIESAYLSVYLWSQAVKSAQSATPDKVLQAIKGQGVMAPEGMVSIDPHTLHVWKTVRIGQVNKQGQFSIIWDSNYPIKPEPFPSSRTPQQWKNYLDTLFQQWDGHWEKPQ